MTTHAAILLGTTLATLAIAHDIDEARYVELGAELPAVVQVGGMGSGTVIAPEWVLTAAHVPEMLQRMRPEAALFVTVGETRIEVAEVHVAPQRAAEAELHDIALLRLKSPVEAEIEPIGFWRDIPRSGQDVVIAGWGVLAVADKGIELSPAAMAAPTRARRAGRNVIDRYEPDTGLLYGDLDAPGEGVDLEAGPSIGDSGGPALVRVAGQDGSPATWRIAGVLALIDDTDQDRILGEYGEEFGMTSVVGHLDWIESLVAH